MDTDQKYNTLKKILQSFDKVLIAYSGGVDSTFLAKVALDTLGPQNVLACIFTGPTMPVSQKDRAVKLAADMGLALEQIKTSELDSPDFCSNKADRCFHCKSHLYRFLTELAKEKKIENILCGSNLDDMNDYRPGNRAAKVFNVKSPLADARLTKNDIRTLSRILNLPTADIPASPCLASRIPYGQQITNEKLKQVELAEDYLTSLGFVEVRVRHHGDMARIELNPQQIEMITKDPTRTKVTEKLKSIGFNYTTIDLQGFRSGSLNETLTEEEKKLNTDQGF